MTDKPKPACLSIALSALTLCTFGIVSAQTEPPEPAASSRPPAGADPLQSEARAFDYYLGRGVTQDIPASVPYFEHAAAAGRGVSQHTLGQILWFGQGGVPREVERSLELTRRAAEQGVALAQSFMGWAYMSGNGVDQDADEAREWLAAAARQQDGYGTFLLALLISSIDASEENFRNLSAMMVRAAELGHANARLPAGRSLLFGPQEYRNPAKGMYLLELASEGENGELAAFLIGEAYLFGEAVERDYDSAARWMQKAVDADHAGATIWLAQMISSGRGLAQDDRRAQELLTGAAERISPSELNNFAWLLSVSPQEGIRDGGFAIRLMDIVLADPQNRMPGYLDTLAAAYGESGDFEQAARTQSEAIGMLDMVDASDATRVSFQRRLELYQSGEPYRASD